MANGVSFLIPAYNEAAEITGEVCRRKLRVYETPIAYYGRTYAAGKNISWRDGFKAIRMLVQVRLRRM